MDGIPSISFLNFYNLKNLKSTHVRVLLLKSTLLHGSILRFLNCANDTKSRKASHVTGFYSNIKLPIKDYVIFNTYLTLNM